ncbi:MAG: hypothetical protein IT368_03760 [Candidatus Hydrogenedentes bacterium]|nr:hypothetical protein [Candidatus Hydrogenedentota bacterium]
MQEFVIRHPHNEASALIQMHNRRLLDALGWREGFWIVCDEKPVHKALAALGRPAVALARTENVGEPDWEVRPMKCIRGKHSSTKDTDDSEACAQAGAWIYVFGSQFGSKDGPLDPERHFVARFNASLVRQKKKRLRTRIDVARKPFLLHRIINDALRRAELRLLNRGDEEIRRYIAATRDHGIKKNKRWAKRIRPDDRPVNIEGATFVPTGRLLLGLRYPVTEDGNPIVVEIDGIDRIFQKKRKAGWPDVTRVWVLSNVGKPDAPQGIRELDQFGDTIHAVTGDLDSQEDRSSVLADHPDGVEAASQHFTFTIPRDDRMSIEANHVRSFRNEANVEGIAVALDGSVWYAHDDDCIRLQHSDGKQNPD